MIRKAVFAAAMLVVFCFAAAPVLSADNAAAPAFAGCDSMPMTKDRYSNIWTKPGFDIKQFGTIVIERPGVSGLKPSDRVNYDEFATMFHSNITDRIKTAGFYREVTWNRPAAAVRTLVLRSEFTEMTPGSTAARWTVGFGAGRGAVTARSALLADGKDVVMCWQSRHMDASSATGRILLERGMAVLADRLFFYFDRYYRAGQ